MFLAAYVMFLIIGLMRNPSNTVLVKEAAPVTKEETVTGVIIRDGKLLYRENLKNGMQHIVTRVICVAVGDPLRYLSNDESQTKQK